MHGESRRAERCTTPTAGTPPPHQPGALGVLAPRALLTAKNAFQVLLCASTKNQIPSLWLSSAPWPSSLCAFCPSPFPAASSLPALSTSTCVPPFALGFWHGALQYNLQPMAQGSSPSCQPPFSCQRGCDHSPPSLIAFAAPDLLLRETSLERSS